MTRRLILDDDPDRHAAFEKRYADDVRTHVYNIAEFELAVEKGRYDVVHLDHDLGDYVLGMYGVECERTGYDAAVILATKATWTPETVSIHSWNPDGTKRMFCVLRERLSDVRVEPFSF